MASVNPDPILAAPLGGTPLRENSLPVDVAGEPLPPHPLVPGLYASNGEKREWLRRIFDDTAADYDRVESWLSLGSGRWYRRQAIKRAGLGPGMRVADVACGTGLVAREALKLVGPSGYIVGIDQSEAMLACARANLGIQTVIGRAESLPCESSLFDFVTMGYALRHMDDLRVAFAEFRRVLKPGGRVCILEITRPTGRLGRQLLRTYMGVLCTGVRLVRPRKRTSELWNYYWQTIDQCVPAERVLQALRDAGFVSVERQVQFGVFSEYRGTRPA
jgi:demethylmenaquinone methyltransferase / 2-methoxy-6-polyprenyl-1,4-benzoquinol methylase